MRSIVSIVLLLLLTSKLAYSLFWMVNFSIYQKEIAELECVNKDRPEMNCNGNCYLSKQLKKADLELDQKKEESSKRLSQLKSLEGNDIFFFEILSYGPFSNPREEKSTFNYGYTDSYNFEFHFIKFNPPCLLV